MKWLKAEFKMNKDPDLRDRAYHTLWPITSADEENIVEIFTQAGFRFDGIRLDADDIPNAWYTYMEGGESKKTSGCIPVDEVTLSTMQAKAEHIEKTHTLKDEARSEKPRGEAFFVSPKDPRNFWTKNSEKVYDNATVQTSDVPQDIKGKIEEIQKTIPEELLCDSEDDEDKEWINNGLQKLFHLTILYGIKDDDIDLVKEVADEFGPIKVTCKEVNYFDNKEESGHYVLKVECESEELEELHNALRDNIENQHRAEGFSAHLTIAYLTEKLPELSKFSPIEFEIDTIEVSKTDGTQEEIKL